MINHTDNLATPADRAVVVPNNDTLCSSGWYDLRYGDLQIDVPPMDHLNIPTSQHPNERTERAGRPTAITRAGAKFGLGGHQAIENRSYTAQLDDERNAPDGAQPLTLRFEADVLPPCNAFWSLTAYGTDMYLVENEIDRWSIGDRTPGLIYADDGSFTIHISAERPEDISNWLPVPAVPYLMGLRVYEGHDEVVACEWSSPALIKTTV